MPNAIYDPISANPLAGNPLQSRADMQQALTDLFAPLLPYFSTGNARVRLSGGAAHFDRIAADIEGFARPLWGLVPFAAGGGQFAHWDRFREGLANGTDPEHPEYWGLMPRKDQRMVEMAAIGFALKVLPHILWEPQSQRVKDNIARYLTEIRKYEYSANNWRFFRVFVDLGLEEVGVPFDRGPTRDYLDELDGYYIADGWYRDGNRRRIDHYIPFAMHFYGLIYAGLARPDDPYAQRYRERARLFANDMVHWFDDEGGALAFGRSLTYRFACGGFWGALAYADVDALPWQTVKGHLLRHMRWWAGHPICDRDGVLSVGYGYPNLLMSESYNSAGSPYWALKAFLPLALAQDHPFWQAEEEPARSHDAPVPLKHPGMVMMHTKGNVVALSSGQENLEMRAGPEKYAKLVYSSRYGFSVEADEKMLKTAAIDGMLALSDDGQHFRVREKNASAKIAGDTLYAQWHPWRDVVVETWLVPRAPWHLRIHRIVTPRPLTTLEGGFAIARADLEADTLEEGESRALARGGADVSAIADAGSSVTRAGHVRRSLPNTNLVVAKALVPQLSGEIPAGESLLVTAAMALPDPQAEVVVPADVPTVAELSALFARDGEDVSAIAVPEPD